MSVRPIRRVGVLVSVLALASRVSAEVPSPTIEGPITAPGAIFLPSTTFDLASVGYLGEEYFLSGTASAYTNVGPLGIDGRWTVTPGATAAYKTRIVVHRPIDRKKFNGTVFVEWLNVSGGVDAPPDWLLAHTALIREGFAWVGVSAQYVGVEGGPGFVNVLSLPLKTVDAARYGSLVHPHDSFSYDIFSQAGQAIRQPSGPNPLGDLKVKKVIAGGQSQSAFRLVNYVNAIHPITHVYDGYLVHSRAGFSFITPLAEAPQSPIQVPDNVPLRSDLDVPVLTLETETDLTFLAYLPARQDDSRNFRLWEVAGTSHVDTYTIAGMTDVGDSPDVVAPIITASPVPGIIDCGAPINSGPHHFVTSAAIVALDRWVRRGKAPKSAPRLEVAPGPPIAIMVDEHGNGRGGIRTPMVDAPIATFTGEQPGPLICRLFGTTTLFDAAKLRALYPTHKAFLSPYNKSLRRALRAGWILRPDAKLMKEWASGSGIGS